MKFSIDGAVLRHHREELGLGREALARLSRVSKATIEGYEGKRNGRPALDTTIEALARVLGLSPEELAPDYVPPMPAFPRVKFDHRRLRDLRSEHGLTHAQVARRTGLTERTLERLESGAQGSARPATLYKLAKVYRVKPGTISPLLGMVPLSDERDAFGLSHAVPAGDPELNGGKIGFKPWLIGQRGRSDHVGHLAEDAYHDNEWPRGRPTLERLEAYLRQDNAPEGAFEGLREAWAEYQAFCAHVAD